MINLELTCLLQIINILNLEQKNLRVTCTKAQKRKKKEPSLSFFNQTKKNFYFTCKKKQTCRCHIIRLFIIIITKSQSTKTFFLSVKYLLQGE